MIELLAGALVGDLFSFEASEADIAPRPYVSRGSGIVAAHRRRARTLANAPCRVAAARRALTSGRVGPERPVVFRPMGFSGPPSEPDVRLLPHPALHVLMPSPIGAASSTWRVPATRPQPGRATNRRYSPATSSPRIDAASTLDPFAMCTAFPCSDYYGSSAPLRRHRPATGLPRRDGRDQRSGSHVHPRTLQRGRCPAMPLQPRHGYAAVLHGGLPADDLNRPKSSPGGQAVRVRVATQPRSVRFELVVFA